MIATAGTYDLTIQQGATFELRFAIQDDSDDPIDLSGFSARMQIRVAHGAEEALVALDTQSLGGIAITTELGEIVVSIHANETAQLPAVVGRYDFKLIEPGGTVVRLIEGIATITPKITE